MELDSIYDSILESYVYDYMVFEDTLRRDYYEVSGILNEDGNKNFLKNIIDKIIAAFRWVKNKIKEIWNKIFKKGNKEENNSSSSSSSSDTKSSSTSSSSSSSSSDTSTPSTKERVEWYSLQKMQKKYKPLFKKYKNKLKDFEMDGYHLKKDINSNVRKYFDRRNPDGLEGSAAYILNETISKSIMFTFKSGNYEFDKYYEILSNADLKEYSDNLKDSWYSKEPIKKPYQYDDKLSYYIINVFSNITKDLKNYDPIDIKKTLKLYEQREKELNQLKDIIEKADSTVEYFKFDGIEYPRSELPKALNKLSSLLMKCNKITLIRHSSYLKMNHEIDKQCMKLFKATCRYIDELERQSTNKEESYIDMDYINAITEAEMYELEL